MGIEEEILPPSEVKRLRKEFEELVLRIAPERPEVLVVLDRSGRPLGLTVKDILKEACGIRVRVFFVDPRLFVRNYDWLHRAKDKRLDAIIPQLTRENPQLVKEVFGKRVVVLDDQLNKGWTLNSVKLVIEKMGAKRVLAEALSRADRVHKPTYSWRARGLHVIERSDKLTTVSKRRVLSALERQELLELRKRMRTHIAPWAILNVRKKLNRRL